MQAIASYTTKEGRAIETALISNLGDDVFRAWLGETSIQIQANGAVLFCFATQFTMDRVRSDYWAAIEAAVFKALPKHTDIQFVLTEKTTPALHEAVDPPQPDFFQPVIQEVPMKDDVHLLSFAPFTLSSRGRPTRLEYNNVNGMKVVLSAPEEYGIITSEDYDFVVMMMSELNEKANLWRYLMQEWRSGGEVGPKPYMPPRKMRPTVKDIEAFKRKEFGGRQYKAIEAMLDRLHNTSCKMVRVGRSRRRTGSFNFISHYDVISKSKSGAVTEMEVTYPEWVYEGIVREDQPTLNTMSPDYVRIRRPIGKFLYRLARSEAAKGSARLRLAEVYDRSPSDQPQKEFNRELTEYVKSLSKQSTDSNQFPDYEFTIDGPPRARDLVMTFIGETNIVIPPT